MLFFSPGRSYCVKSMKMLNQCLESLVQKVQSGVVLNFEKVGPEPVISGADGMYRTMYFVFLDDKVVF